MGVSSIMSNIYVLLASVLLSSVVCDISQGGHHHRHHHHRHVVPVRRQHVPLLHQVLPFLGNNRQNPFLPKRVQLKRKVNSGRFSPYSTLTSRDANIIHQQIRRTEGTEIFEGRKPDVIHYIESPVFLAKNDDYRNGIDERSPVTNIVA